jgi:hypothetical protein
MSDNTNAPQLFYVCWRVRATGVKGRSIEPSVREIADAWVKAMNAKYRGMDHWLEEAEDD